MTWLHKNCASRAFVSSYNWQEPIIVYGKLNKKYPIDIIDAPVRAGFLLKDDTYYFNHPHPKPLLLIRKLIEPQSPKSVIDIFGGSCRTAEMCEELGVKYLCVEIKDDFVDDIQFAIDEGIRKYANAPPRKSKKLLSYAKED